MIATKQIKDFTISENSSLKQALQAITKNKERIIFIVSEKFILKGVLTDGDIRRYLTSITDASLDEIVVSVMNRDFISLDEKSISNAPKLFNKQIDCIPVISKNGRLVKLVFQNKQGFFVEDKEISESSKVFIIAEIGNNHQGDISMAKMLVDEAKSAGADCAKFQMRNMSSVYKNDGKSDDASADLGVQYTTDLLERYQLSNEELFDIFDYCKSKDILPMCTPWDNESLNHLENYGMSAYKVASADFTNFELLEKVNATGKPFFCSTGMSTENEIKSTVKFLDSLGATYALLHCNSTYPTPYKDINLKYISRLKELSKKIIGFSGHERGGFIPIAAVALGAKIIEKHITLDKELEGVDHKVSLLPVQFKDMVDEIRHLELSLGNDNYVREISQGEMLNRHNLSKSIIALCDIKEGDLIKRDYLQVKSPGQGLQPNRIDELIGKKAIRDINEGDFFYESDLKEKIFKSENYLFQRPFGVPVRYHDYDDITAETNLDFIEFHLSYKDLNVSPEEFIKKNDHLDFAVHSPELFAGDHILDLSCDDNSYRLHSIKELKNVIELTKKLKEFFPKTKKPVLILNAGGFNNDGFINADKKSRMYQTVSETLNDINLDGIQLAIQTMPPFPWHFGGQSYHNLFIDPNEINKFCLENKKIKICLDISHSMMACNYFGWDLIEFVEIISKHVVHLHIVDAKGHDGEGVEIGKGDVDFNHLSKILNNCLPNIQFIPEVWQGHKNKGEGFWNALNFLEKYL